MATLALKQLKNTVPREQAAAALRAVNTAAAARNPTYWENDA